MAGVSTAVLEGGDGQPVVLLHGGIECGGVYWAPVLSRLAERHRVVVPDVPGLGESKPVARLDSASFDAWLTALIEQTCLEKPLLVAHSLVGSLAARYATLHGDALRQLVIYGTPGVAPYRLPLGLMLAAILFDLRPSQRNMDRFARWAFLDPAVTRRRDPEWLGAFDAYNLARGAVPHVKQTMRHLIRTCTKRVPDADLQRIGIPVTLIWGRHDRMAPLRVGEVASSTPSAGACTSSRTPPRPSHRAAGRVRGGAAPGPRTTDRKGGSSMSTSTIDMAGLTGGSVNLMPEHLEELETAIEGSILRCRRRGLGRGGADLERDGGQVARARRPAGIGRRRLAAVGFAREHGLLLEHQGRRPQHRRHRDRRAAASRSTCPGCATSRSTPTPSSRTSGRAACSQDVDRATQEHGLATRARLHLRGRRRRSDARRRPRLPDPPLRLDGRQPRGGRDRHRGRRDPHGQPRRERRPVLGAPRRRRQLRRRHPLHASACTRSARPSTAG